MSTRQTQPALTICVIGRNEAANLQDCSKSLRAVKEAGISMETLYVDSASSDESVRIARENFDVVIELDASPHLNASAARAIGTEQARADWILYLDGDMRLSKEYIPLIQQQLTHGDVSAGIAGWTHNQYPDGSSDFIVFHGNTDGKPCRAFGGAVMLNRKAVLSAGNWAPNLYSNEEIELFSRLTRLGHEVRWNDVIMVEHVTEKFNNGDKLLSNLMPYRSFLGKKFYGAGQATRLALTHGNLASLVHLKSNQYLMAAALIASLLLLPLKASWAVAPAAFAFCYITATRGAKFAVNCVCWTSQVLFGWGKLKVDFRPHISNIHRRPDSIPHTP